MTQFFHVLHPIKIFFPLLVVLSSLIAQQKNQVSLAENLLRDGNYESALSIFQNQYNHGDNSNKVINGISRCLEELSLIEEWVIFLKDIQLKLPGSYNFQVDLGRAYFQNQQLKLAKKTWQDVYRFEPLDIMRFRLVGQAMTQVRLFDEAIEVYKLAVENISNQDALNLEIANLYRIQLDYENAAKHYLIYFYKYKKQLNYIRSMLINMAKDEDASGRIINAIQESDFTGDPDVQEILSNLYMRKKDYAHALEIILAIENKNNKTQFAYLNRFAIEAAKDNAFEYVIQAYENLIKLTAPNNLGEAQLKLAQAYFRSGMDLLKAKDKSQSEKRINQALVILGKLMSDDKNNQNEAAELSGDIFKIYYTDLDNALKKYQSIKLQRLASVNSDRLRIKMADIYLLKNDLLNAAKEFKNVKSNNYLAYSNYNLAEINYYLGQFSMSKKGFLELIKQVGMKDSLANNALDRTFEIELFSQDSLNYALFSHAVLLERQNKLSQAAKIFADLFRSDNITSFSSGLKAVKIYNLLNMEIESNIILQGIIENYPDDEQIDYIYFLLANNYKKNGNYGEALSLYQEILIHFPTSFYIEDARTSAREINSILKENLN